MSRQPVLHLFLAAVAWTGFVGIVVWTVLFLAGGVVSPVVDGPSHTDPTVATPRMGASHLLFAIVATVYVAVGVTFEERDLRRSFGAEYDAYAARVPALIPRLPFQTGLRLP